MVRGEGRLYASTALIEGLGALDHPELTPGKIAEIPGNLKEACSRVAGIARGHGVFVAGIVCAPTKEADAAVKATVPDPPAMAETALTVSQALKSEANRWR
jgi:hypothetical protein